MKCTVNDIARAGGVSRTTVLRALSDKPDVSAQTKARIRQLAAEMRYSPNYIARSLTLGRSNLVGVVADPSLYYSFNSTFEAVEHMLREAGYSMLLYVLGGGEETFVEQFMKNRVDGVIAVPSSRMAAAGPYRELIDSGIKLVTIDGCIEGLDAPQILGDNYSAARLATEHLISLGHRAISYLAIPRSSFAGKERARGFRDAMTEAGLPIGESSVVETEFSEEMGCEVAARLLSRRDRPTAFLVRHDIVARGVMRGALAAGFSVPDDVSIVGSGDIPGSDMFRVPLTTVCFPARQMASIGVRTLLDLLEDKPVAVETTVLEVSLVVR